MTVNANTDLSRIISPELCTTTFVYNGSHQLCAWVNPLGDRTSFIYQSGSVFAVQQPLGQRSTSFFGPPHKGDCLEHLSASDCNSFRSPMTPPSVAGCMNSLGVA